MSAFAKTSGDDSGHDLNERYNRANGRWEWQWSPFGPGMSTCAGRGLPGPGQVVFPPGVMIGATGSELRLTTGSAPPVASLWNQGDRVHSTIAVNAGDVEGWMSTTAVVVTLR